ncbi:uncharacterized protein YbaR (Trm112 family) [Nakamurella flavida]|uniref:Trm112 family protein n=1 Tax=Nakamurella flavida TaxID=363630 RepID=UPI00278332C5|nr:Trm112 family protein [Nakamurella flavida]MDP9777641.1 uncharacterized protein YbaR (Trm112 family) [Nakamurella flavida]
MPRTDAGLDPLLLEVLACPAEHHAPLRLDEAAAGEVGGDPRPVLICTECGRSFPIRDGIPVLLLDDADPGPAAP